MLPLAQLLKQSSEPIYIGTVLENNASGQVQVTIQDIMVGDTNTLPWLSVVGTPGGQSKPSIAIGSQVIVTFPFSDFNHGLVIGSLQNEATRPAGITTKDQYGFADEKGNTMIVDKESQTVHVETETGVVVDIAQSGDITITAPKNVTLNTTDDFSINCKNFNLTASASIKLDAGSTATYSATGQMNIESQAQVGFTAGTSIAGSAPLYAWS